MAPASSKKPLKSLAERLKEGSAEDAEDEIEAENSSSDEEEEAELPPPAPLDKNVNWSLLENVLQALTPSSWEKVDVQRAELERLEMIRNMPLFHKDANGNDVPEKVKVFFEDTEEVRAEPELGGLGPGLTGEHTLYSFVVGHVGSKGEKKWKMKMRYSQFFAFDQHLTEYLRQIGIPQDRLPEFPEKVFFGSMSPKLVKDRMAALEFYFKELVKDREIVREPIVRMFLKLPMTQDDVDNLDSEYEGAGGDGMMNGLGEFKSLFIKTREEKKKGRHHTQKKETFAGAPTLAGAAEVGEAFAKSSVHDKENTNKWVFRIPIISDFGGQRVGDIFGDEVRGLHSTYNSKIKKQVEKSAKEKRERTADGREKFITSDGYDQDGNFVG